MSNYRIIATSAFGLESVVSGELEALGYDNLIKENGRVSFTGDEHDIVNCNLWLRCADRVRIEMGSFQANDFEDLFQGTKAIAWENFLPEDAFIHVTGKSVKSGLHSVPHCQSIVKKAIIESMKRKYNRNTFPEDGPSYKIEISMLKNTASLTIDTSGDGLHKRGYRTDSGRAPLRETLAAGLVYLSRWEPSRILADPMCGSGTIAIEAAMIGRNIPPGINRSFASEKWTLIPSKIWKKIREAAMAKINGESLTIYASDNSKSSLKTAMDNAGRAGVADDITFQKKPLTEFSSKKKYGCIITNPSYGVRIGSEAEVKSLYSEMGPVFGDLDTWSYFILSGYEDFEKIFGRKADRNRKLYNGRIKCFLYQYFGPLPVRK